MGNSADIANYTRNDNEPGECVDNHLMENDMDVDVGASTSIIGSCAQNFSSATNITVTVSDTENNDSCTTIIASVSSPVNDSTDFVGYNTNIQNPTGSNVENIDSDDVNITAPVDNVTEVVNSISKVINIFNYSRDHIYTAHASNNDSRSKVCLDQKL